MLDIQIVHPTLPVIMLGDFNKVLEDREHKGQNKNIQHSGIKVKEPLQTLRGKPPFTPYSAFTNVKTSGGK